MGVNRMSVRNVRGLLHAVTRRAARTKKKIRNIGRKIISKVKRKIINQLIKRKIYRKALFSISDLFYMQEKNGILTRVDVVVRYMTIRDSYSKAPDVRQHAFDLYKKMQRARLGGYESKCEKHFKKLIIAHESRTKAGKHWDDDGRSPILLDRNLNLIDGSHRLALGIYFHEKNIRARIVNGERAYDYSLHWFFANGFNDEEIDRILDAEREVREQLNTPFSAVIWSPAVQFADEIIKDLGYYGTVTGSRKIRYRKLEYENIVRAVYAIDDIERWKIEEKLKHMRNSEPELVEVRLRLKDPLFRVKASSSQPISTVGEHVKLAIRGKYKSRIPDYFYDIVLHTSDNFLQSRYMEKVFDPGIDCRKIISAMNGLGYALAKTDVPYMPEDFPDHIPVGKDIDVLVLPRDFEEMKRRQIEIARGNRFYDIEVRSSDHGALIRYHDGNHLIFLVDITYKMSAWQGNWENNADFLADAVENRVGAKGAGGLAYYVLSPQYEYIFRMAEYRKSPAKIYHRDYLREHRRDYDRELSAKYIDADVEALLKG